MNLPKTSEVRHDWVKEKLLPSPFVNVRKELRYLETELRNPDMRTLTRNSLKKVQEGFGLINSNYDRIIDELGNLGENRDVRSVFIVQSALKMVGYSLQADGIYRSREQVRKNQISETMQALAQYRSDHNLPTETSLIDESLLASLSSEINKKRIPTLDSPDIS